jgi:hypothetical protein
MSKYGVQIYSETIKKALPEISPSDLARLQMDKDGETKLTNLLLCKLLDRLDSQAEHREAMSIPHDLIEKSDLSKLFTTKFELDGNSPDK